MSRYRKCNYNTLADFARAVNVDRSTVLAWVRAGRIKSQKRNKKSKKRHYLSNRYFSPKVIGQFKKPYPKYSKTWTKTELHILRNWTAGDAALAKALGRSVNAIRIKRSRISKERRVRQGA